MCSPKVCPSGCYFYPRSTRGERRERFTATQRAYWISIHAPHEGSDRPCRPSRNVVLDFYPRSPRGERRGDQRARPPRRRHFYPRSPRGERQEARYWEKVLGNFYPRSPRGERLKTCSYVAKYVIFLSTLPTRGATKLFSELLKKRRYFYPRSPRGERRFTTA